MSASAASDSMILAEIRDELRQIRLLTQAREPDGATVNAAGAAALLHTSVRAIYVRRARGKMPRPLSRKPLVWRTADVLAMKG